MTYPSAPDPQHEPQQPQPPQYGAPYAQQNPYGATDAYGQPNPYGQPQPAYNPYGSPVQPGVPPQPQGGTNGFAIASLILGILGGGLLAVIFGIIALTQIPKRNQKGKGLAIGGLVASGVWLLICGVIAAIGIFADNTDNSGAEPASTLPSVSTNKSLKVGDCINGLLSQDLSKNMRTPPAVDCAEEHEGEVFQVALMSGATFPGDTAVKDKAESTCTETALSAYAPDDKTKDLEIYYLYPTSSSWIFGDRDITCLIVSEKAKITGSLRK